MFAIPPSLFSPSFAFVTLFLGKRRITRKEKGNEEKLIDRPEDGLDGRGASSLY
jgi:hypothetical protein